MAHVDPRIGDDRDRIERFLLLNKTKVDAPELARSLVDFLDRGKAQKAKTELTDGLSMEQRSRGWITVSPWVDLC